MTLLARRLKEARLRVGLSQERLGLEAGLDAMSASTRMNRYEAGARVPDFSLMERVAAVLSVPTAFFYTEDDDLADLLVLYHALPQRAKKQLLRIVRDLRSS